MDRSTRNETIRALAAATAAAIRTRPARSLAAVSGEINYDAASESEMPVPRCTERDLPIERARNCERGDA
jgi:hypothetical protein